MTRLWTVMSWSGCMKEIESTTDTAVAVTYIRENFRPEDRLAVVLLNKRTNAVIQRLAEAQKIAEPDFQAWLRLKNNNHRCEIYISMNALHSNAQGRTKEDVAAIRHIYLDFDLDGTAEVEALLKRGDVPKPNYLINTSPDKWQVAWKVVGFGKDEAEALQRGLARDTGSDPSATDCARVLRLPGFHNHKYGRGYLVRAKALTQETYGPERFPRFSGGELGHRAVSRAGDRSPKGGPVKLSQSERDWGYARRALARGESPAIVAAAIASHRRFDKHDPQGYADRTVRKAAAHLQSSETRNAIEQPER